MSLELYDKALTEKVNGWLSRSDFNGTITSPNDTHRLFEIQDETQGGIKLPLVTVNRSGGFQLLNTTKQDRTYDGFRLLSKETFREDNTPDGKSAVINVLPIRIDYQIDIYTKYLEEATLLVRELIFSMVNDPRLIIEIPYNGIEVNNQGEKEKGVFKHASNIIVDSKVEDNSSIPERLISGQFTRLSIMIFIDDAYLWDTRVCKNIHMSEIEIKN